MFVLNKDEILNKSQKKLRPVHYVYFLISDGEIVYVGQSKDIKMRISAHRTYYKKFDSFTLLRVKKSEVDEIEKYYINKFRPKYNKGAVLL